MKKTIQQLFLLLRKQPLLLIIISSVILFTFILHGCKKNDPSPVLPTHEANFVQQFFALKQPVNDTVADIIAKLKAENERTGFVDKLPANCGLPVWDKLILQRPVTNTRKSFSANLDGDAPDTAIVIPLTNTNEALSGVLTAVPATTGYNISCHTVNNLYNICHATAATIDTTAAQQELTLFFFMENRTFGTKKFYHIPATLFKQLTTLDAAGDKTITILDNPPVNGFMTTICMDISHCCHLPPCNDFYCDGCWQCTVEECSVIISGGDIPPTGPTPPGSTTPPSGGTGGTGGSTPCPLTTNVTWYGLMPPPDPCGGTPTVPPNVLWLQTLLGLNTTQTNWLTQHIDRANELYNYLELGVNADKNEIALIHLNLLMTDTDYLNFLGTHAQAGNNSVMWWQDNTWLRNIVYTLPNENILNFYIDAAKPKHKKPQEFANKCDGVQFISQASKNDKNERAGLVTLDGKFLFTETGNGTGVDVGIKVKNGQAYYSYKTGLGAPTLAYYGMMIYNNEYWIPVRTSVHIHIPDFGVNGVSITMNLLKSVDDDAVANLVQKYSTAQFNLYVVEAKDNGKFLVASYDKNSPNYYIEDNDILLLDICKNIN